MPSLRYRPKTLKSVAALLAGILLAILLLPLSSSSQEPPGSPAPASAGGEKKTEGNGRGPAKPSGETVLGVDVSKAMSLPDIIEKISEKRIVYAGERHTAYEDHVVQLEIIKGLLSRGSEVAIGMEMFQKPYQKALDDYIGGRTDEREFLKASRYFKTWRFDYNLYRDILRFAREKKIPVVALNIRNEIIEKVSKKGIDSLSEEEKKELPEHMDMTDEDYKKRLKEAYEAHTALDMMSFENFYQAQIIWDETMAQSVHRYLKENPDRRMVVIAGAGHVGYGSGIPKRAFRRNGLDYAIVLCDSPVEKGIADFVLYPKEEKTPSSPKLGVVLQDEDGRVRIIELVEKGVAEKAGLKKDDAIISLDGEKTETSDDVRIFLLGRKEGDTVTVTVLRKRFLFGERELTFEVKL